jgi:hypothetical protein
MTAESSTTPAPAEDHLAHVFSKINIGVSDITMTRCMFCENPGKLLCTTCRAAHYCSKKCQLVDWKRHKCEHERGMRYWSILIALEDVNLLYNPLIRVKHTGDPQMGMGVFARQDIKAGTCVFSEKTYMATTLSKLSTQFLKKADTLTLFQFWSVEHNSTLKTEKERAQSAICRNGLMDSVSGMTVGDPMFALFFIFPRFNHSCGPNTSHHYNTRNSTISVYAARDLKKGEEITLYWHHAYFLDRDSRDTLFTSRFGTKCACEVCTKEDIHVMDEVMEQAIENVFEILKTEETFHKFLDSQDPLGVLTVRLNFRNMLALTDMLHGFTKNETFPYSPYRKIVHKKFARFLSTYRKFQALPKTPFVISKFNEIVNESIEYFHTLQEPIEVENLKKLLLIQ